MTPSVKRRRVGNNRTGHAPFELVLFLPLLMVMLAAIMTTAQMAVTDASTSVKARHIAFQARRTPLDSGTDYQARTLGMSQMDRIADVRGPSPAGSADAGLLVSATTQPVPVMFQRLAGRLPDAKGQCAVVGGTWDHEDIRFASESQHPRLTLGKKVAYFGTSLGNLGMFGDLLSFGGAATAHGLESLQGAVGQNRQAVGDSDGGISRLQSDIQQLLRQIASELSRRKPNAGRINGWRRQIEEKRQQIQQLNRAKDLLNK